jgi:alanyl-tRNA synthetase
MTAREIIDIYISFFEKRGHKRIANSALVPENDPTTLFTSSGMQPLVPYLLGEQHPAGKRLVNVQNCFRAVDIEEVGDNRHETFFRMLGNWSLGDYFKSEEIPWLWELLTKEFGLPKEKLYITVFAGTDGVPRDNEAFEIWKRIVPENKIFFAGVDKNWWSRSGVPANMPVGEIGGPDSEVYYKFDELEHKSECKDNPVECECGKFLEIANSVFMQYRKVETGFEELPNKNVDYGGGVERLMAAVENTPDVFQTNLFAPIIKMIEDESGKKYEVNKKEMQIIADHLAASIFITNAHIKPSNKDQGYVLRRLLRRALDNFSTLGGENISAVIEKIVEQYSETDNELKANFAEIKLTILEEETNYKGTLKRAQQLIERTYTRKEVEGVREISADDAFLLYSTHGLSPTQIRSLGYVFNEQQFAEKMEEHQRLSRTGAGQRFKGGLADHSEKTIMGHTATHLLHQALRDMFGQQLHQTGSNITSERVRFDFNFDRKLEDSEIAEIEKVVNGKISENLPVHFEIMPLAKAKEIGAIGLFDEKYQEDVKVYFVGDYSKELCGGPHVDFTGRIKKFKIIKQENIGQGQRRLYAVVG